jgi:hypothetical protein
MSVSHFSHNIVCDVFLTIGPLAISQISNTFRPTPVSHGRRSVWLLEWRPRGEFGANRNIGAAAKLAANPEIAIFSERDFPPSDFVDDCPTLF